MILNEWEKKEAVAGTASVFKISKSAVYDCLQPLACLESGSLRSGDQNLSFVLGLRPLRAAR